MRRFTIAPFALSALSVLSLGVLVGCEDGPNQTYEPAPDGAASRQNDGDAKGAADNAKQGFNESSNNSAGTNAQVLCTAAEKQKRASIMIKQPIIPPRFAGGLDLAGDDSYKGLLIQEAEKGFDRVDYPEYPGEKAYKLCQSDNVGGDGGTSDQAWGDNQEIVASYILSTKQIYVLFINQGYQGAMEFKSRPGSKYGDHTYTIPINSHILRDGQPFEFQWGSAVNNAATAASELYDAAIFNYAPFVPPEPDGVSCASSGHCVIGSFGDVAYWYVPAFGLGFLVESTKAGPVVASTPIQMQMYKTKTLGFSLADATLKLDAQGPFGFAPKVGALGKPCNVFFGQAFGDFLDQCVAVAGDDKGNQIELNKFLGGETHDREEFSYDISGIDVDFKKMDLDPNWIIKDTDHAASTDRLSSLDVDQSMLGKIANDYKNNDPNQPQDWHGSGLVWLEYARLTQAALQSYRTDICEDPKACPAGKAPRRTLGDPACLAPNLTQDPVTGTWQFPQGCTGFEGFVTAAPPLAQVPADEPYLNKVALGTLAVSGVAGLGSGLKPGHPQAGFCVKLAEGTKPSGCSAGLGGVVGDIFSTSYARALAVFGKGKTANMPPEIRDGRFFFKQFTYAFNKYLLAAGKNQETAQGVHAIKVNDDDFFFDSAGAGQFESGEYIDRTSVGQDPNGFLGMTDVIIVADIKNGILNDYFFDRQFPRQEVAIYQAYRDTTKPGAVGADADSVLMTNIFGSPILKGIYGGLGSKAYACATKVTPASCSGATAPVDANGQPILDSLGRPILTPYKGAIEGAGPLNIGKTPVVVEETFPTISSARISIPLYANPYDPMSGPQPGTDGFLKVTVPAIPKQPGVGFPIPVSGTINKFISTALFDFSGSSVTYAVYYDADIDDKTKLPKDDGSLAIKAAYSSDFLGLVFFCDDPETKDLLTIRMYDPAENVLKWFNDHPGAVSACDVVFRYSTYNNVLDYVTSRKAGITFGVTAGGGYGRVNEVWLFDPATPYLERASGEPSHAQQDRIRSFRTFCPSHARPPVPRRALPRGSGRHGVRVRPPVPQRRLQREPVPPQVVHRPQRGRLERGLGLDVQGHDRPDLQPQPAG